MDGPSILSSLQRAQGFGTPGTLLPTPLSSDNSVCDRIIEGMAVSPYLIFILSPGPDLTF